MNDRHFDDFDAGLQAEDIFEARELPPPDHDDTCPDCGLYIGNCRCLWLGDGEPFDIDGDHAEPLASAGYGTDEDYGGWDDGDDWGF